MLNFDGDALVYIAGFASDSRNGPLSHSLHNLKLIINKALDVTGEDEYRIFLTSKDPAINFRTEILPEYKKNRAKRCKKCGSTNISKESYIDRFSTGDGIMKRRMFTCLNMVDVLEIDNMVEGTVKSVRQVCSNPVGDSKPVYYNKIRFYLIEHYGALVCQWGEADDWLGLGNPSCIATHDKDIYQLGEMNFYNLKSGEVLEVPDQLGAIWLTETGILKGCGFKWFCCQMLTGDTVDNIPKPHKGDGPKWIYKIFNPLDSLESCWNMVKLYYHGTNNSDKLWLMAQLLWISREKYQRCSAEVIEEMLNNEIHSS